MKPGTKEKLIKWKENSSTDLKSILSTVTFTIKLFQLHKEIVRRDKNTKLAIECLQKINL